MKILYIIELLRAQIVFQDSRSFGPSVEECGSDDCMAYGRLRKLNGKKLKRTTTTPNKKWTVSKLLCDRLRNNAQKLNYYA